MIRFAACLVAFLGSAQNAIDDRAHATLVLLPREAYVEQAPAPRVPRGGDITVCVGFEGLTARRRARADRVARLARELDTSVSSVYGGLNSLSRKVISTDDHLEFVITIDLFRPHTSWTCGCYDHSAENLAEWAAELERIVSGGSAPPLWTMIFSRY